MKRIRRAAPNVLVLGALLLVLSTGSAAVAQVVSAAKADSTIAGLVIDRLAYLVVANLTVWALALVAMWRWSGVRLREANAEAIREHDGKKDAHEAAAHENHAPILAAMHGLDLGMTAVLGKLNVIAETVKTDARLLDDLSERMQLIEKEHAAFHGPRDPGATPHKCRTHEGGDFTPLRGKQ